MQASLSGKVILNAYDLSEYLNKVASEVERELKERNVFAGQGAKRYVKGLLAAKADLEGFYNFSAEAKENIDAIFRNAVINDADNKLTYSVGALSIGGLAILMTLTNTKAGVNEIAAGSLLMSVLNGVTNRNGAGVPAFLLGNWLMDATVMGETNGTTVDKGAAATGYFVRFIYLDGQSTAGIVLQHSTNGSTWVDLETSSNQAEETVVDRYSTSVTINRYVRAKATPDGANAKVLVVLVHGYAG
jgi:hypothetical protein